MKKYIFSNRVWVLLLSLLCIIAVMPVAAANPWQAMLYNADTGGLIRIDSSGTTINTYSLPTLPGDQYPWQIAVSENGARVAYVIQNPGSSERRFEVYDLASNTLLISYVISVGPMDWVYDNLELLATSLVFDSSSNLVAFGYVIEDSWEMIALDVRSGGSLVGYISSTDPAASIVDADNWVPVIRYHTGSEIHFMMIPPATEGLPTYPAYRWNPDTNVIEEDDTLNAMGDFNPETGEAIMPLPDDRFPERSDDLMGPGWHSNTIQVVTPPETGSFPFYHDENFNLGSTYFIQGGERVLTSAWEMAGDTLQWRVLERSGAQVGLLPFDGYLSRVKSLSDGFVYQGNSEWMGSHFPSLAGTPNAEALAVIQTSGSISGPGSLVWNGGTDENWRMVWLREEGDISAPTGGWAELAPPVSPGGSTSTPPPSSGVCEPLPPSTPRVLTIPGYAQVTADGNNLNVRVQPGTGSTIVTIIHTGNVVEVTDGPCEIDGFIWWRIRTPDGPGWAAQGSGSTLWLQPFFGDPDAIPTATPVPTSPPSGELVAPIQTSPADGVLLTNFPRTTTLEWQPVAGAILYRVGIQWCEGAGYTSCHDYPLVETSSTSHTFNFIGDQPGRWRVWAVVNGAVEGPQSPWWGFIYDTLPDAPTIIGPADGTTFSIFPRTTTLEWQPVPGATVYKVEIQWCSPGMVTCNDYPLVETGSTSHTFDFIGAQPGRWRVWAVVGSVEGAKSPWYTFTHTH